MTPHEALRAIRQIVEECLACRDAVPMRDEHHPKRFVVEWPDGVVIAGVARLRPDLVVSLYWKDGRWAVVQHAHYPADMPIAEAIAASLLAYAHEFPGRQPQEAHLSFPDGP